MHIIKLFVLSIVVTSVWAQNLKFLDGTAINFNNDTFNHSEVQRILDTINARKKIAAKNYTLEEYGYNDVVEHIINFQIVKAHLADIGYAIKDDQVEQMINSISKQNNISKEQLISFLKSEGLTFDEYFELLRESRIYELFMGVIISPLISVTDQEIKNEFFKRNISNTTLSVKYGLMDFSISKDVITEDDAKAFQDALRVNKTTGVLDTRFKQMEVADIGQTEETDLGGKLRDLLKRTPEGDFSEVILLGDYYHVFYVNKKDLIESTLYKQQKAKIQYDIYNRSSKEIVELWLSRERNKHFIRICKENDSSCNTRT